MMCTVDGALQVALRETSIAGGTRVRIQPHSVLHIVEPRNDVIKGQKLGQTDPA
jgi:hypothetical protein